MSAIFSKTVSSIRLGALASLYGLASFFFIANFYSWGLQNSFSKLLGLSIIFGPVFGLISFYLNAFTLQLIGIAFGGNGTFSHLKEAVAWSKIPYFITISMWTILSIAQPEMVFVHYATSASAISIILVSTLVNFIAFGLLVKAIKRIQHFSALRAFFTSLTAFSLTCLISLVIMFIARYIYVYKI